MQGYILKTVPVRDEDLVVHLLTSRRLYRLYRFYGARHSTINLGYKIDFTIEYQGGYLPKLRNVIHLGTPWLRELPKVAVWQSWITLLWNHLQGVGTIDPFYLSLLDDQSRWLVRQDPKRAIVEGYTRLLDFEGRLQREALCFRCGGIIGGEKIALGPSFLPAHGECIGGEGVSMGGVGHLFTYYDSQYLQDREIDLLYRTLLKGL
ncbi:MAG: recombination protein RecO [Epsilonproteobacteria bacterium]|nr:recombination protein RecO [Campylobacterota bacterium]NPA56274.1 recombination protein RecO [Campylobacterota bacterium]